MTNIALGIVVGGLLALGLTLLIEFRDRRLRTADEIEALLQQAVIGYIPSFKKPSKASLALPSRLGMAQPRLKALPNKA